MKNTDHDHDMLRAAELSDDGVYRYSLTRRWGSGRHVTFVMLNPSTADALVDDPTIRRCIGFARAWGFGALCVVNLYALRSTDPRQLWEHPQPVGGPEDDAAIAKALRDDALVLAAMGARALHRPVDEILPATHRAAMDAVAWPAFGRA